MTEHPGPVEPAEPAEADEAVEPAEAVEEPVPTDRPKPAGRRRVRRRASREGTNPAADDAPDVLAPREEPAPGESQHDRWLREQRPPHWE